ncbi:hypothetical protein NDU88_004338 [Pleurodeles waltl]|uniref:Uncharacterized protein n=1 Tax=Pleurodeles waltl TaxID=8319 RepID=A0AAV7TTX6_PLEWA|nr:hypothetical protein NDU88_004338 [Pleurodeles waltl]
MRAELLAAIHGTRVALEGKIETVAVEVNRLQADFRKVSNKVKVAEGSIVDLQTEVGTLRKQMAQVTSTVGTLEARLEDSEGRSRRHNVHLFGFPERAEGSTVESSVEQWIREVLQAEGPSRVFVVERAHRASAAPPRPGAPPWAIIACLLNYKDRDCILRTARETDRAVFENRKISIFPDIRIRSSVPDKGFWRVGPCPSRRSGAGSAHTPGVEGSDWRRRGDAPSRNSALQCDDSVSRTEIQQDGTMPVVDPEQVVELAGPLDVEAGALSVDSCLCGPLGDTVRAAWQGAL